MSELQPGIYELLVTEGLRARLDDVQSRLPIDVGRLDPADAADRIAWHVSRQIELALLDVSEDQRVEVAVKLAHALLDRLGDVVEFDPTVHLANPASVLHSIRRRRPDGSCALRPSETGAS